MTQEARKGYLRPLSEYVTRALDPLAAQRGFAEASMLTRWDVVVGARIGRLCHPIRIQWPPRAIKTPVDKPQEPGMLVLRVEPGFGLDIQHLIPQIIDRVNTHLGWRCVAKVAIRQEPLRILPRKDPPRPPRNAAARALAEKLTEGITRKELRAALVELGEKVLVRRV